MKCTTVRKKAGLFAVLMGFITSSYAIESGDIENRVGFIDESTGAKVEAIERGEQSGEYRVLISIPGKGESAGMEIEEVLVSAPSIAPDLDDKPAPTRYEFVNDYSADRYGLYIYIGKSKDWPFRIYFKDHDSELMEQR
ncbi:MAG: hypothetical protein ACI8RU_002258 [Zhongshania aliphaticivorans]|jgi:hypothetical protein|uniref:hypothetical protein n=1 Tax=Zhongshania aliphaticivorans TaxID=1470434 RepID=UPI0039E3B265|tara:strand:- start:6750 stop:7166 length:417 start_codon:yes stop_codon:yes gene_type:complete